MSEIRTSPDFGHIMVVQIPDAQDCLKSEPVLCHVNRTVKPSSVGERQLLIKILSRDWSSIPGKIVHFLCVDFSPQIGTTVSKYIVGSKEDAPSST